MAPPFVLLKTALRVQKIRFSVSESRQAMTGSAPEGRLFKNSYAFDGSHIEFALIYADKYTNNGSLRLVFKDDSKTVIECAQNFYVDLAILSKTVEAVKLK